ncbi:MAG: hypothetical protein ISS82_03795 [Nanoarchaeota archaeon]|nr:hypothetical protein [Nanoarchaeota archaeon]
MELKIKNLISEHFGLPVFGGIYPISGTFSEFDPNNAFLIYPTRHGKIKEVGLRFSCDDEDKERLENISKNSERDFDRIVSNGGTQLSIVGAFYGHELNSLIGTFSMSKIEFQTTRQKHFDFVTKFYCNKSHEGFFEGKALQNGFGVTENYFVLLDLRKSTPIFLSNLYPKFFDHLFLELPDRIKRLDKDISCALELKESIVKHYSDEIDY